MISLIMLTYNRMNLVSNMINDILKQTYDDYELVIINNGSTDSTGRLLKNFALRDKRFRIIELDKPVTIGKARNIGVAASKGDFLAFVDDDDRISEDYLDFLLSLLEDNKSDISICGCSEGDGITRIPQCIYDEKMVVSGRLATEMLLRREKIRAGMPTKLYKREIIVKYPFDENCKNEDIHTQYKYLLEAGRVAMHGIDKYYILRHGGNVSEFTAVSSKWTKEILRDYLRAYSDRTAYIKEKAPDLLVLQKYCEWSFWISMIDKIETNDLVDCKQIEDDLKQKLWEVKDAFLNDKEIKDFETAWMERYVLNG